jgi:hypothetical protein
MRLTVGPLPAAVYWRRRGVVLVGLAMVVLIIWYAFSGPDGNADTNAAPTPSASGTTPAPSTAVPSTRPTTASPSASAFTLPVGGATGPCTDAELEVVAAASASEVVIGAKVDVIFTIKIKNVSSRTCVRNIGADVQELQLRYGDVIVWSSDDCGANHGEDLKQFTPGLEVSFDRQWPRVRSRTGNNTVDCNLTIGPDPGEYELVARLDQKFSAPFPLTIRPS